MQPVKAALTTTFFLALVPFAMAHPPELLTRFDADGDGAVSRAEFHDRRHAAAPGCWELRTPMVMAR